MNARRPSLLGFKGAKLAKLKKAVNFGRSEKLDKLLTKLGKTRQRVR